MGKSQIYKLNQVYYLQVPLITVWNYFANPNNLTDLTPPTLDLKNISFVPPKIYPGLIIKHEVKTPFGTRQEWVSEITEVVEQRYFIDVQRKGPFKMWKHEHSFRNIEGGTEVKDIAHYQVPGGLIGQLFNKFYLNNKILKTFEFRRARLEEIFGVRKVSKKGRVYD